MGKATYGTGTIFKRGRIWYVAYFVDGKQKVRSSKSANIQEAKKLRDQILGKKARGELAPATGGATTCGELLDDLLEHAHSNLKESTEKIFKWCIEANIRPYFGQTKVSRLTTKTLKEYRQKRLAEGRAETTCNRELSILRIALNLGRKCTPPKVIVIPHFPMVREENARQGFLTDQQYAKLRDVLPDYLRPLFVVAYFTGVRLGELLAWTWDKVDFRQGFVTLSAEETKSGYARAVPIIGGDMRTWLEWSRDNANGCDYVFHRAGSPIKHFRAAWATACQSAEVPELKFHDLRRTAVRNMRRAGVAQVVRMRITGHRTDSMERRYNIVDIEDIRSAKDLMERRSSDDKGAAR